MTVRVVGMTGIVKTDCRKPWLLDFYTVEWPVYVSPGVILLLYFVLACETRRWYNRVSIKPANTPARLPPELLWVAYSDIRTIDK